MTTNRAAATLSLSAMVNHCISPPLYKQTRNCSYTTIWVTTLGFKDGGRAR